MLSVRPELFPAVGEQLLPGIKTTGEAQVAFGGNWANAYSCEHNNNRVDIILFIAFEYFLKAI